MRLDWAFIRTAVRNSIEQAVLDIPAILGRQAD